MLALESPKELCLSARAAGAVHCGTYRAMLPRLGTSRTPIARGRLRSLIGLHAVAGLAPLHPLSETPDGL